MNMNDNIEFAQTRIENPTYRFIYARYNKCLDYKKNSIIKFRYKNNTNYKII